MVINLTILDEIKAVSELDYPQTQLNEFGIKPKVPRLCPETCKNKDIGDNCQMCNGDFSHFQCISLEEYNRRLRQ